MPNGTQFKANPPEIARLGKTLLADLKELQDTTAALRTDFNKLGETFLDSGYTELDTYLSNIEKQIASRGNHMKYVAAQVVNYAEALMRAIMKQSQQ